MPKRTYKALLVASAAAARAINTALQSLNNGDALVAELAPTEDAKATKLYTTVWLSKKDFDAWQSTLSKTAGIAGQYTWEQIEKPHAVDNTYATREASFTAKSVVRAKPKDAVEVDLGP